MTAARLSDGTLRAHVERLAKRASAQCALRAAHKRHAAISKEIDSLIPAAFPVGSEVSWQHGEHYRRATVLAHSFERLKVRGSSGREYWICVWRVLL